jgi:hypothetical protein
VVCCKSRNSGVSWPRYSTSNIGYLFSNCNISIVSCLLFLFVWKFKIAHTTSKKRVSPPTVEIREVHSTVCLRQMMDQHIPNANAEKAIAEPTLNNGDDLHSTNGLVLEKEPTTKVAESPAGKEDESKYPQGFKLWMILTALYIAMFLVALVCIPHIHSPLAVLFL